MRLLERNLNVRSSFCIHQKSLTLVRIQLKFLAFGVGFEVVAGSLGARGRATAGAEQQMNTTVLQRKERSMTGRNRAIAETITGKVIASTLDSSIFSLSGQVI